MTARHISSLITYLYPERGTGDRAGVGTLTPKNAALKDLIMHFERYFLSLALCVFYSEPRLTDMLQTGNMDLPPIPYSNCELPYQIPTFVGDYRSSKET